MHTLTRPVEGQREFSLCSTLTRHVFVIQLFHISHVFELLFVAVDAFRRKCKSSVGGGAPALLCETRSV